MKNVIAIYHEPQECGSPFIAFVSQETGDEVDRITIPHGYYWEGMRGVERLTKVDEITETVCTTVPPTKECYQPKAKYIDSGANHRRYVVTKVDIDSEDFHVLHTFNCTVHIDVCEADTDYEYIRELDHFSSRIEEELGFDMSDWDTPKRMNTDYFDFLKMVISAVRPDYHLVNLIKIH